MAKIIWSEQQLQAIKATGSNVLVSAAAGSGKTTVLTERLLRQILSGTDITEILVVTFTEAAASHMRNSISKALRKAIEATDDTATKTYLKSQLAKLPTTNIKTLHSFCLDITRQYFAYTDTDLNSKVLDDNESKILRSKVVSDLLDNHATSDNCHLLQEILPILAKSKRGSILAEHILSLYDLIWEQPFPEIWMKHQAEHYLPGNSETFWLNLLKKQCFPETTLALKDSLDTVNSLLRVLEYEDLGRKVSDINGMLEKYQPYKTTLEEYISTVKGLQTHCSWDDLISLAQRAGQLQLPSIMWRNIPPVLSDLKARIKSCNNRLKSALSAIPMISSQQMEICLAEQLPQVEYIFSLVREFADNYRITKQEANSIDFGDMQRGAIELLWYIDEDSGMAKISDVARAIRSQYSQIMEDEYQDSNNLQEWILRAISDGPESIPLDQEMTADMVSHGPHMFMVGDIKQSIYGFRNAEPSLFISKYASYAQNSKAGQVVDLQGNYRSSPDVLDSVNAIFRRNMSLALGGSDYDNRAMLLPGLNKPETCCDKAYSHPVDYYCVNDSTQAEVMVSVIQDAIANKQLYDYKLGVWRNYTYSDICILQRGLKNNGVQIKQALESVGIPAYFSDNTAYLSTYEVQTVISALRITDNPLQDKDLMAVALSPMFDIPGETFALLKGLFPAARYYWDRFVAFVATDIDNPALTTFNPRLIQDAHACCAKFLNTLENWRSLCKQLPPERLIWHIITSTGFYNIVETMQHGETRVANLRLLFSYAVKYSSTSLKGITNFIRFLERVVSQESDLPATQPLADNSVTITTIHKSKGLEFPMVIVGNMRSMFVSADYASSLLKSSSLGIAIKRFDATTNSQYDAATHKLLSNEIKNANRSEELRLLYVALTRAMDHLVLIDDYHIEKIRENKDELLNSLPGESTCYAKWVLPAAFNNPTLFNIISYDNERTEVDITSISATIPDINTDISQDCLSQILLPQENPYEFSTAPSKISVTRVERMFGPADKTSSLFTQAEMERSEDTEIISVSQTEMDLAQSIQDFILGLDKQISATARGTINHLFMEKLDFSKADSLEELQAQLDDMCFSRIFTSQEAATINLEGVLFACNHPELKPLLNTCPLHRESAFNMLVDYQTLMDSQDITSLGKYVPVKSTTLMQGIIDLWIETAPGQAVVVDYKTGRCTEENLILYKRQLNMYALALTRLTGLKVTQKYVVFLDEKRVYSL